MADNENKELMQFLEKQFEGIYKRLDNTATKDDLEAKITAAKEEVMRHTGVLFEAVDKKIDIVIEGIMTVNERLEKMILINSADISKLDQRVGKLEERA